MNARKITQPITLTALAVTVLVILGNAAQASPQLKEQATTVAIVVLAALSLSGILAALIGPLFRPIIVARRHRHTGPVSVDKPMASTFTGARS
ncbi:hypothetical protein [Pseudonocardia sp. GCM10023141]|uniref:hypothetical protein n=1 Tax=Pseudonocardia sp. GCM10023141 TaxID=3252653 RepID=UPI003609B483